MFWSFTRYVGGLIQAQISLLAFFCVPSTSTRSSRRRMKRPWASTSGSRTSGSTMRGLMVKRVIGPAGEPDARIRGRAWRRGGRGGRARVRPGRGGRAAAAAGGEAVTARRRAERTERREGREHGEPPESRTARTAREGIDDASDDLRGGRVTFGAQVPEPVEARRPRRRVVASSYSPFMRTRRVRPSPPDVSGVTIASSPDHARRSGWTSTTKAAPAAALRSAGPG